MNTEFKYKEVEEVYNIANANLLTLYHIIDNMAETIKSYFTTFKVQYDSNTYKFIINTDTFMFVIVQNMDNITLDIVLNGDAIVQDVAYAMVSLLKVGPVWLITLLHLLILFVRHLVIVTHLNSLQRQTRNNHEIIL